MKSLRYFFLGALVGAAINAILVSALYLSPWRVSLYLKVDPSISTARTKLTEYRETLTTADLYLAQVTAANRSTLQVDSVKSAQARAWREYKAWRNHLGELAKTHTKQSPVGFVNWCMSMVVWLLPLKLFLTLGLGLVALLWGNKRFAESMHPPRKRPRAQGETGMMNSSATAKLPAGGFATRGLGVKGTSIQEQLQNEQLQEVVRRVAEISAQNPMPSPTSKIPQRPAKSETLFVDTRSVQHQADTHKIAGQRITDYRLAEQQAAELRAAQLRASTPAPQRDGVISPYAQFGDADRLNSEALVSPKAKPPKDASDGQNSFTPASPLEGLSPDDTAYIEVLAGWQDDMIAPVTARQDSRPPADPVTSLNALVMQDEDAYPRKTEIRDAGLGLYKEPLANRSDEEMEMPQTASAGDILDATLDDNPYAQSPWAGMPETTEFEKLERQRDDVLKLARKGLTSSEISRRLKVSQDEVDVIIRMRREKG